MTPIDLLAAGIDHQRDALASMREKALRPPPRLTVDGWADEFRRLAREAGSTSGRWKTSKVEVARGPMRAVTEPGVRTITVATCTQLLKSSLLENVFGYFAHLDPCPILLVEPKDEAIQAFAQGTHRSDGRDDARVARPDRRSEDAEQRQHHDVPKVPPAGSSRWSRRVRRRIWRCVLSGSCCSTRSTSIRRRKRVIRPTWRKNGRRRSRRTACQFARVRRPTTRDASPSLTPRAINAARLFGVRIATIGRPWISSNTSSGTRQRTTNISRTPRGCSANPAASAGRRRSGLRRWRRSGGVKPVRSSTANVDNDPSPRLFGGVARRRRGRVRQGLALG